MDQESAKVIKVIKSKEKASSSVAEEFDVDSIEQDGVIRGEVYSASARARELLGKAQEQADSILQKAKEAADQQKQQGYDAGYQEGLAQTTELLAKARLEYEQFVKNAHKDLLDLAFKVAEKIIGRQLETDETTVLDIVSQAMKSVRQSRELTIRVHPDDAKVLKKNEEALIEKLGRQRVVDILEDKKIQKGGCVIESEIGIVEAQLHTQLERLKKVITSLKAGH